MYQKYHNTWANRCSSTFTVTILNYFEYIDIAREYSRVLHEYSCVYTLEYSPTHMSTYLGRYLYILSYLGKSNVRIKLYGLYLPTLHEQCPQW